MRVVRAYLLREIMSIFIIALIIITVLFMSQRIIQLTEWAVNRGVGPAAIVRLLMYHLPAVLNIVIPIVTLFSILLGVGRLSSDNEITALKSAGVSLYRLFPPVLLFSVLAFALGLLASQLLAPRSAVAIQALEYRVIKTRTDAAVQERTFVEVLKNFTLYVREKSPDGELRGLFASQEKRRGDQPWKLRRTIVAASGRFVHDPDALDNELWLHDGVIISEDKKTKRDDFVSFQTCRIRLQFEEHTGNRDERRSQLDSFELRDAIKQGRSLPDPDEREREELLKRIILFHERLAMPFGCIALCFWGVPLGIQPPRAGRSRAIVVSVLISALFYYLMVLSKFAALKGWMPPALAIWTPGAYILLSGMYMLRQKNLEQPIFLFSWAEDMIYYLTDRVRTWVEARRKKA